MVEKTTVENPKYNFAFWLHFAITALAWLGPFLFDWRLMCIAYGVVLLQFAFFKKCFMNSMHTLSDANDETFYSHLFDKCRIRVNKKSLKIFVRNYLYIVLALFTVFLQKVLGFEPLLF